MKRIVVITLALFCTLALGATAPKPLPENVYSVNTCPGEDASVEMNISWATDSTLTDSYVVYTTADDRNWKKALFARPEQVEFCTVFDGVYSKTPQNEDFYENARFYKCGATLRNLAPDTQYKYYIASGKKLRKGIPLCREYSFKTAGAEQWSACIISDFHSYTPLGKRLVAAMDMIETVKEFDPSIDWIFSPGDVCAWGGSYSFWKELYEQKQYSDYFWASVNGNHDNMTRKSFLTNEFFRNNTYNPSNGYEGEMGVCYHFRYGNALFIMLNNENMRQNAQLLQAQRWVKKVVTEARASENPPLYVIVCEHYQWFYGPDGDKMQYRRWHELFDELGVDLAVAGNDHIYTRSYPIFDDKATDGTYGTVFFNTSSSDNERGRNIKQDPPKYPELVAKRFTEGGKTVSALDMKVNSEKIVLTLLDRYGNVQDEFEVLAKKERKVKEDIRGNYLRDSLEVFKGRCQDVLDAAYMTEHYLATTDTIPGWEGYPVKLYEYWTGVDVNMGAKKRGLVYLLNPDAEKLATWIINAVYDATGDLRYDDLEKIRKFIKWQSGAQFPVKGVVYEAMYAPGDYYPYLFKDGVTVYIRDDHPMKWENAFCTDEQLDFYTRMENSDLKDYTGRYARIASTNRQMYYAAGGTDEVGQDDKRIQTWLDTVAKEYKKAWKSDRNFLIYALAKYQLCQ